MCRLMVVVVASVVIWIGPATLLMADVNADEITKILNEWKPTADQKSRLSVVLLRATDTDDGGIGTVRSVLGDSGVKNAAVIFDVLRDMDVARREKLLVGLLLSTPALDESMRNSCAYLLEATTHKCSSDLLFDTVKTAEKPDDITIIVAIAFAETRKAELEQLALKWSKTILKETGGEADQAVQQSLIRLLGLVGKQACYETVLRYLDVAWEADAPTVLLAVEVLGKGKFVQSFSRLKEIARKRDPADTHVRIGALRSLAEIAKPSQVDELIGIARSIYGSGTPFPEEAKRALDEVIKRLQEAR